MYGGDPIKRNRALSPWVGLVVFGRVPKTSAPTFWRDAAVLWAEDLPNGFKCFLGFSCASLRAAEATHGGNTQTRGDSVLGRGRLLQACRRGRGPHSRSASRVAQRPD